MMSGSSGKVPFSVWDHVHKEKNGHWQCKFCGKKFSGRPNRIMAHLAKEEGRGIQICGRVDEDISQQALQALQLQAEPSNRGGNNNSKRRRLENDGVSDVPMGNTVNNILVPQASDAERNTTLPSIAIVDPNSGTNAHIGVPSAMPQYTRVLGPSTDVDSNENHSTQPAVAPEDPELMRQSYIDEIWKCLTEDDISLICVQGMGGVGKTTIVKHLHDKVIKERKAFKSVFWVTVSNDCPIDQLQREIARVTGAKEIFEDKDKAIWRDSLEEHLRKRGKSLLILDIVWKPFELAGVGIPCEDIKVVITTRDRRICDQMSCRKIVKIDLLGEQAAWSLFKKELRQTQEMLSDCEVERIARDIVRECAGLPLAIVVMARSMRAVKGARRWWITLTELKSTDESQKDMKEEVFRILRSSYDNLNDKQKKECFLRCALYPEYHKISRIELIELYIDEGLIRGDSRGELYDKGYWLLDELVDVGLLLNIGHSDDLKMHDVVRDMALDIMVEKCRCIVKAGDNLYCIPDEDLWKPNLEMVSLMQSGIMEVPNISPKCPQLSILLLGFNRKLRKIPDCFLREMLQLKVIDLRLSSIKKVPDSLLNLSNLTALVVRGCFKLGHIPSLENLVSLRKLDLFGCISLEEVPEGLEKLVNLTYLNLIGAGKIKRLPEGVLCNLVKLQHLLVDFVEVKGAEVAKLNELEKFYLPIFSNGNELSECAYLFVRRWHVNVGSKKDVESFDRDFCEEPPYEKLFLRTSLFEDFEYEDMWDPYDEDRDPYNNGNTLVVWNTNLSEGYWSLPISFTTLKIVNCRGMWNMSVFWPIEKLLKELEIFCVDEIPFCSWEWDKELIPFIQVNLFPKLERLHIYQSINAGLEETKNLSLPWLSFYAKELKIENCSAIEDISGPAIRALPSAAIPPGASSKLQSIHIDGCYRMKNLVGPELLPLLKNLRKITIGGCDAMEEIIVPPAISSETTHLLPHLTSLVISFCPRMKRVLTLDLFIQLPSLSVITVEFCDEMKEVIGRDDDRLATTTCENISPAADLAASPILPNFKKLKFTLSNLPNLETICDSIALRDCVEVIEIRSCPKLKKIGMLDVPFESSPLSLQKIALDTWSYEVMVSWWESLDWEHLEAKDALQPFVFMRKGDRCFSLEEWRRKRTAGAQPNS